MGGTSRGAGGQSAGADDEGSRDGAGALKRHPGSLEGRIDDSISGRTEQFVFGDQAQGPGIPHHEEPIGDALLCRRQAARPVLLIHWKCRGTLCVWTWCFARTLATKI